MGSWKKFKGLPIIISLLSILCVLIAFSIYLYSNSKVLPGISIGEFKASGLTKEDLSIKFTEETKKLGNDRIITLVSGNYSQPVTRSDVKLDIDVSATIDKAYLYGHSGSYFKRFKETCGALFGHINIDAVSTYSQANLTKILNTFYNKTYVKPLDATYALDVKNKILILRSGHSGYGINKNKALNDAVTIVKSLKDESLSIPTEPIVQKKFDVNVLYKELSAAAKDAEIKVNSSNNLEYVKELYGVKVDKELLNNAVKKISDQTDAVERINIELLNPKHTIDELKSNLFKDTLASYTTNFGGSTYNRVSNIKLAASRYNGKILGSGDIFSYNNTVGQRTVEKGFREAGAYSEGQVVQEVGGGICQTSTTLYSAILYADLEVVERYNHMFIVTYVPLGQDATVSWPGPDFRFKNNTAYPIKIVASVSGTSLTVSIIGTKTPGENKKVTLKSVTTAVTPPSVIKKNDPTLKEGVTKVLEQGHTGYTAELYKTVTVNGKVVRKGLLTVNKYNSSPTTLLVGTKKVKKTKK